jgi:hypothetical protein
MKVYGLISLNIKTNNMDNSKELLNTVINVIDELQIELVDENIDVYTFYYDILELRDYIKTNMQ